MPHSNLRRSALPPSKAAPSPVRLSSFVLATVLLSAALAPAKSLAGTPTPDQVIEKWIDAIGGRKALEKITSRDAKGTLELTAMNMSAQFIYRAKNPNLRFTEVNLQGLGTVREGFDGQTAWSVNPATGNAEKSGAELARAKREAVFHRELNLHSLYPTLEVVGPGEVSGRKTWILKATPSEGAPDTFHLDAESGILLKQESTVDSPGGPIPSEVYFEDYRKVDGVNLAFSVRMASPETLAFTLRFTEIRHNVELAPSTFAKPKN